ncbi:MAG: TonB-dependent receptor [Acidobacteria bacterium]|nr:TonB-dependent receptor [Acidobacteriota bacterium]
MSRTLHALALSLLTLPSLLAQTSRGTVSGFVSDPTAAAIAGAKVELKSLSTGVNRETTTNESGIYRFDAVDLGAYEVTVSSPGFQQLKTQSFEVVAGQIRTIDARLEVGEQKNVIQVSAEAAQLQVEAPVRGANLDTTSIASLPFASRNPVSLALTVPGVSSNRAGFGVNTFVVNGARGRSNNFLIDGTENNDISVAGQAFQIKNVDAIQEVNVQTSNFDSEFGRAGGGVVNVITKGGTNAFHGTASFLLDVTNDDATTLTQSLSDDVKKRGKPLPGTDWWASGTIGGPIVRNRLFFFQSFQDERQHASGLTDVIVPSAAGRSTLNSLFPKGRNPRVDLYNEVTSAYNGVANLFTQALGNGRPDIEFGTSTIPYPQTYRDWQSTTRIDYALSPRNQISGRYLIETTPQPIGAINFPGFITTQLNRYQNALVSWTRVVSPTLTNELRLPYNRITLAFPIDPSNPLGKTLPLYNIAGLNGSGIGRGIAGTFGVQTNLPQGRIANNYDVQDTVSWVKGVHSFRFGTELLRQRSRQFAPIVERGALAYQTSTGYSGFANFVDDFGGSNGTSQRDFGNPAYYPNLFRQSYFIQDRWRLRKSVTLTLGLRYENFGVPVNTLRTPAYEGIFNVDPVNFTGPFSNANKVNADNNNFAPAFGLAWNPSSDSGILGWLLGNQKTVIRTGYQLGYDSFFNNIASNAATSSPNVVATLTTSAVTAALPRGTANFSQSLPTVPRALTPLDSQALVLKNLRNPYYQRWSFGIQRELRRNVVLDVSYVGSKGTKLFATEQFNPLVPSSLRVTPANVASIPASRLVGRLDPLSGSRNIRTNNGSSIYNALQTNLSKRYSSGLSFNVAYTYSKLIDYGSEIFANSNAAASAVVPSVLGGLPRERGVSLFDRTHRFVTTYSYDLPFLKSQKNLAGRALGGWTVMGVYSHETGTPVTVTNGLDADGIDGANDRPNFNPSGQPGVRAIPGNSPTGYINPDLPGRPAIDPSTAQYIALPANSSTVTPGVTGNLGRNTFRSGPTNNWDVNFQKGVKITERFQAQFRAEFYNFFNHPQRGIGSVSPFSPGYVNGPGNSTPSGSVANSPAGQFLNLGVLDGGGRVVRYQLKFLF